MPHVVQGLGHFPIRLVGRTAYHHGHGESVGAIFPAVLALFQQVDRGQLLALLIDELFGLAATEAAPVLTKVLLEQEGYPGPTHGYAKDQGTLDQVEHHRDVLQWLHVHQRKCVKQPPNPDNDKKFCVQVETEKGRPRQIVTEITGNCHNLLDLEMLHTAVVN